MARYEDRRVNVRRVIDSIYKTESRRVLATLIRLLGGDFDLAEDALQEAFAAALRQWDRDGVPANPRAWLVSTGRFKAIDAIRSRARSDASFAKLANEIETVAYMPELVDEDDVEDDRLRLIFICCNPALSPEARVALTLREVCDLTTEQIASSFLIAPSTLAQRIVRAKTKIRTAKIPYRLPPREELADRLEAVLQVIYLVFTEGYSASSGASLTRPDLSAEAIRLAQLVNLLLPNEPEAQGLLALMLLHESRRPARTSPGGDLILLEDQDRSRWNRAQITEGKVLVEAALSSGRFGAYTLQAAIAAVHAGAPEAARTDWAEIVGLYGLLLRIDSSPVIELNRAVAIAMRDGPDVGVSLIDTILGDGELDDYYLAHSARADLCRRAGRVAEARWSYSRALDLAQQEPERRYLERRLGEMEEQPAQK